MVHYSCRALNILKIKDNKFSSTKLVMLYCELNQSNLFIYLNLFTIQKIYLIPKVGRHLVGDEIVLRLPKVFLLLRRREF